MTAAVETKVGSLMAVKSAKATVSTSGIEENLINGKQIMAGKIQMYQRNQ